jgi:hypothetical protein
MKVSQIPNMEQRYQSCTVTLKYNIPKRPVSAVPWNVVFRCHSCES